MDPSARDPPAVTLTFEVGEAKGLPSNLTSRIELKGPRLLDAVCSQKLTIKLLDVTQEGKEKTVCLGSASLSLVPLLQETQHIKQNVVLALNPEAFTTTTGQAEEGTRTVSLDVTVTASACLIFPEDLDDWNVFSISVGGIYNLPPSFSMFGATGPQDADSHPLSYTILFLGSRLNGGSLVLPIQHSDEKPAVVANNSKGKKVEKQHAGGKNNANDRKGDTHKEAPRGEPRGATTGAGGTGGSAPSSSEDASSEKHHELPAGAGRKEEPQGPFLAWEEKEVHFYRGRRFLAQLMHTIDRTGGVWLYLVPKWKTPPSDDKGGKGNYKHLKANTSSGKSKAGNNKPDLQSTQEAWRRLAGRVWVPLDALKEGGCSELSGSFQLQPLEVEEGGGDEEESNVCQDTASGKKQETTTSDATSPPPDSFEDAQTHVKLSIRLKNPLLSVDPSDVHPLDKNTTSAPSSNVVACRDAPPGPKTDANKSSAETGSHVAPAPAAYVPAHDSRCQDASSMAGFKECVQQGIRWIAREVASSFSPAQQHVLAAGMASGQSSPPTAAVNPPAAVGSDANPRASDHCRDKVTETGSSAEWSDNTSPPLPTAATPCSPCINGVDAEENAAAAPGSSPSDDHAVVSSCPRHKSPVLPGGSFQNGGLLDTSEAAATEVLVKHLKMCGCYDELRQKVMRAVSVVVRDQLRQDVVLTAAVGAASVGEKNAVVGDRPGNDEAEQPPRTGDSAKRLSTSLLQQRLDRFLSEVFVQLVDTLQTTVNEITIESQRARERRRLQAPEPPLWVSPEEAEAATLEGEKKVSSSAFGTWRPSSQQPTGEGKDDTIARLSFEAEVVGDMPRSVYLHKCRLTTSHGQKDPALWYSLARLLLRANEANVEQAEKALWKCIDAAGGPQEALPEWLLMLGSCLMHRKRYKQAIASFFRALQRCVASSNPATERDHKHQEKEAQERQHQQQQEAVWSPAKVERFQEDCMDSAPNVVASFDCSTLSSSSSVANPGSSEVLPYFFLCMCYYLSGDTRRFEKYLSLALKPAAYFQLDCLAQQQLEEVRSIVEEDRVLEEADERAGSAVSSSTGTWPEKTFEELEQTLSTFPRDTFYTPMEIDYPALALLLLLLKFGLPSLCSTILALEDTLLHPETRASGLLCLIKAKVYLLKRDFFAATGTLHRLLVLHPKHREALSLLAECYFRQGIVEPATEYFGRSLNFFETSRDCVVYLRLGQLSLEKKDYGAAYTYYKQSLQFSNTCEAWLGVAAALYRLHRLSEALEAATAANWLGRDRGETWGYLALIFLASSSSEDVRECHVRSSSDSSSVHACTDTNKEVKGDTFTLYNNSDTDSTVRHTDTSSNEISNKTKAFSSLSGKSSPCNVSLSYDETGAHSFSGKARDCALSRSRTEAHTIHSGEANTCTRYMLKNGVGGSLGVGRLGGFTTVHTRLSLDPDKISAEDTLAVRDNLGADKESTTRLEWGGGLLVEVAHRHLEVRGAAAAEIAEAVIRRALESPFGGAAAARKVLAEALELQGRNAAAVEELLQVMDLLVEEFEKQQRDRLRVLTLVQNQSSGQQEQHHERQHESRDGHEEETKFQSCSYSVDLEQQIDRQKALTCAKLVETQRKTRQILDKMNSSTDRVLVEDKGKQLLRKLEELNFESQLP